MEQIRRVSKDAFSPVLLTLVAMIEAIAMEKLVDAALLGLKGASAIDWLQLAFVFLTILYIFVTYAIASLVYRLSLRVEDCFIPFFAGVFQFVLIGLSLEGSDVIWFAVAGSLISAASLGGRDILRRASQGDDDYRLGTRFAEIRTSLLVPMFTTAGFLWVGLLLLVGPGPDWLPAPALAGACLAQVFGIGIWARTWAGLTAAT